MGRFMRRFWMPVMRSEDLPKGHAKPIRIMSEDRTRTLVQAQVLRIDQRDMYFQVGEDVYGIHFALPDELRAILGGEEGDQEQKGD